MPGPSFLSSQEPDHLITLGWALGSLEQLDPSTCLPHPFCSCHMIPKAGSESTSKATPDPP